MIMAIEGDTDVMMMFKGNDEHGYVYVCNKESLVPQVSKNASTTTTEAGAGGDGTLVGSSGRRAEVAIEEDMEARRAHRYRKR